MSNYRGPMVPHEMRKQLEQSRALRTCSNTIESLASIVAGQQQFTRDQFEQAIVNAEHAIKDASILIRKLRDEPYSTRLLERD